MQHRKHRRETMKWESMETAPKDGTQILLAAVDTESGVFGIRQGFYERGWFDIDGDSADPHCWCAIDPLPPGAQPLSR
jgi:hypothetical protein